VAARHGKIVQETLGKGDQAIQVNFGQPTGHRFRHLVPDTGPHGLDPRPIGSPRGAALSSDALMEKLRRGSSRNSPGCASSSAPADRAGLLISFGNENPSMWKSSGMI